MFAHTIEVGVLFGSNRPLLAAQLVLCFVCWRVRTPNAFRIGVSYVVHSVYGERFHVPDTYTGLSAFVCIHLCFEEKTFLNSLCIPHPYTIEAVEQGKGQFGNIFSFTLCREVPAILNVQRLVMSAGWLGWQHTKGTPNTFRCSHRGAGWGGWRSSTISSSSSSSPSIDLI